MSILQESYLKCETEKFQDMPSILQNMQERGYIDAISQNIQSIFQSELKFASKRLKQLVQIMKKEGKIFDFNEQFHRNIIIFKTNFDKIVDILIQKLWNKITDEFDHNFLQRHRSQDTLVKSHNLTGFGSSIFVTSGQSPSSTIQHPVQRRSNPNNYTSQDMMRSQKSFMSQKSKSPSMIKPLSKSRLDHMNMSVSSMKSFTSKNGPPVPFSEFSCISGSPTSFPRAQRNLDQSLSTVSPGVGKYDKVAKADKFIRESSTGVTIGRAPKICWIDEKLKKEDSKSPGPKYDVKQNFISKRSTIKK